MRNKLIIAIVPLFFSGIVYAIVGTSNSNQVYVAGSYGYLAKTKSDGSLNTILYPKVDFTGVDYGNKSFVAVGKAGQIMYMPENTTQWQSASSFQLNNYNSVKFLGTKFVAVGDNGMVSLSSDGVNWDNSNSLNVSYKLQDAAGNDSNIIAVGGNGLIYNISFKARVTSPSVDNLNSIVYANDIYVVVGNNGTIIYSTDGGVLWNKATSGVYSNLTTVKFLGGKFYTVGDSGVLLVSGDGIHWTQQVVNSGLKLVDIGYDQQNKNYILIGNDGKYSRILVSNDLVKWNYYQGITTTYLFNRLACGLTKCNIVGNRGMNLVSSDGGENWKILKTNSTEYTLSTIDVNSNTVAALGMGGSILTSRDQGDTWTAVSQGYKGYDFTRVNYLANAFYATGTKGILFKSSDGLNWETLSSQTSVNLNGIAYNSRASGSQYAWLVVGDNGLVLNSVDGLKWQIESNSQIPKLRLTQAVYDTVTKQFYISGYNGTILATKNLKKKNTYTQLTSGTSNNLLNIAAGELTYGKKDADEDVLIAVGDKGTVLFSENKTKPSFSTVDCKLSGSLYSIQISDGAAYLFGQLGAMAKLTLDNNKNPICTLVNSSSDVSLIGSSSQ